MNFTPLILTGIFSCSISLFTYLFLYSFLSSSVSLYPPPSVFLLFSPLTFLASRNSSIFLRLFLLSHLFLGFHLPFLFSPFPFQCYGLKHIGLIVCLRKIIIHNFFMCFKQSFITQILCQGNIVNCNLFCQNLKGSK